jgi:hypothetical protein
MRIAAIIVTLSLLSVPAAFADVYRSVDADGNVVYSDRPSDQEAVRVVIATSPARAPVSVVGRAEPVAETPAEPDEETIAAAERAQLAEDRAANCERARQRNVTYSTSRRLYELNEDGERVYYSDVKLAEARLEAEADVARWCN